MLIDRLNLELIQLELDVHLAAQINLVYYLSFHLAPSFILLLLNLKFEKSLKIEICIMDTVIIKASEMHKPSCIIILKFLMKILLESVEELFC